MDMTIAEIAELVGGTVRGDGAVRIRGVNGIQEAGPGELTFIRSSRYAAYLDTTRASAVIMEKAPEGCPVPVVEVGAPDLAFARVLQAFEKEQVRHPDGIHPSAVISDGATLGEGVAVDAQVCICDEAAIGDGVILYAGVYVGRGVRIGARTVVYPGVVLREETEIGARCIIHANATLGSDGFGFAPLEGRWAKIPQVGRLVIGDDVEIGSNTAIDRATFGATRIGRGTKIDNLVQIGHNVIIGEDCVIAGKAGIAGSAVIGNRVRVGAQAGINGHIDIGDDVTIGARGGVTRPLEAGAVVSGFPALPHHEERRVKVAQRRVPELIRRVRALERRLDAPEDTRDE